MDVAISRSDGNDDAKARARQLLAVAKKALEGRKSGYLTGRAKEEWPPIPQIRQYQIDAVAVWANMHRENNRPLTVAAPLLTIICALYEKGHSFPVARRLAEVLDCSKDGVDAAISMALAYGEITERKEVVQGSVNGRVSSRRLRFLDPSKDLYDVYKNAARHGQPELHSSNG